MEKHTNAMLSQDGEMLKVRQFCICELKPLPSNSWLENLESLPLPFHAQNRLYLIQNIKLRMYSQIKRMHVRTCFNYLV